MIEKFTASNGVVVAEDERGLTLSTTDWRKGREAIAELFLYERDQELGRWRDEPEETWRTIPGYEGYYEVSSEGRVRSIPRTLPDGRARKGKVLKQCTTKGNGRLKVTLARDGRSTNVKVHQLVAQAFLGSAPVGKTLVLHNDGNHLNNRARNLRWGNYSDNVRDSLTHGTWRNQHTAAAHPEPKPWHDAKPGEVWALSVLGGPLTAYGVSGDGSFHHSQDRERLRGDLVDEIVDARRLWPEN